MSENTPNYYAIIPAHVRYCKELELGARLLYGEITALANKTGYAWATNQYFADLYEVDTRTIQRWLESLKEKKFILVEIDKQGLQTSRKIWISQEIQNMFTERQNCRVDATKMSSTYDKNVVQNITSNTTSNNNIYNVPTPEVVATPVIKKSKEAPKEAQDMAQFFYEVVLTLNPNIKKPNLANWSLEFDKLHRIDGRTWDEIRSLILWAKEHHFWYTILLSPSGFRKNWDKMMMQKAPLTNKGSIIQGNKKIAQEAKIALEKSGHGNQMKIYVNEVYDSITKETFKFDLPTETFENLILKYFKLSKN